MIVTFSEEHFAVQHGTQDDRSHVTSHKRGTRADCLPETEQEIMWDIDEVSGSYTAPPSQYAAVTTESAALLPARSDTVPSRTTTEPDGMDWLVPDDCDLPVVAGLLLADAVWE